MSTKALFQKIGEALRQDLQHDLQMVDVVARFDGDPEMAINEHVADLTAQNQASSLYGFEALDIPSRDAALGAKQIAYPVVIVLLKRRLETMEETAEAVDDMMDALLWIFSVYNPDRGVSYFGCDLIVPQPVSMTITDPDANYLGRGVPFLFIKTFQSPQ